MSITYVVYIEKNGPGHGYLGTTLRLKLNDLITSVFVIFKQTAKKGKCGHLLKCIYMYIDTFHACIVHSKNASIIVGTTCINCVNIDTTNSLLALQVVCI